jgi:predicted anti-sigma-YlaC factor YlaD
MPREKVAEHHAMPLCVRALALCIGLSFLVLMASCTGIAVRAAAGIFSGGGSGGNVFTRDDDPELVGDALPFALKTYEALLAADPKNAELSLATGTAFVGYAFAFVQTPADELPAGEVDTQLAMHARAKKLFLRAREYVLRGLEIRRPGFRATLDGQGAAAALRLARRDDIDYLYWAGAAWLAAFSADPFDFSLLVTVPRATALLEQVNAWNESYQMGAVQELFISFHGSAPPDLGGSEQKAREDFRRAVELSGGLTAGPYVALASSVSVKTQNESEFRDLLGKALAVNVDALPAQRLTNIINQRKARWMLDHADRFFLEGQGSE